MSHLIRSCKVVTIAPRSIPPPPTLATIAPAEMDPRSVNPVDPIVALPVTAKRGHRRPCTPDTTSASTTDASGSQQQHSALAHDIGHVVRTYCPMRWKSWKTMPDKTNYNFDDINGNMLVYVNRLFAERYKQSESDLHQYFQTFDDPQVALKEGCPKEVEDQKENWVWLCYHFQEPHNVKPKANKISWEKKTLIHHLGSKPFSYRMEAQPQIDIFADVYVRPRDKLAESLHVSDNDGEEAVDSLGVRLPASSRDSDRLNVSGWLSCEELVLRPRVQCS
ncbi:hypothetical protein D8674_021635 [Pyrus ussuriensis x Pyrus communis]|uniref:Uncharacterized protein n=1 Tax=Pyrus ussuriensis x Pyrus communis TaxID=2448454 RepID=A0A5N5GIU1_9ROSA|nr:hypothetical protein D8674_021635 [Pyrus ussuriensis x Pyrus communis]